MRFVVKFTNGAWKVFDMANYEDVVMHSLYKDAVIDAAKKNSLL